jgi:hypothetical protein
LPNRRLINRVHTRRVGVLLRLLGDFEQSPELLFRSGQSGHSCRHAVVGQVLEDSLRLRALLARLLGEVFAEAL